MSKLGFQKFKKIHMIGIGGSGMIGIATILQKTGFKITGSDLVISDEALRAAAKFADQYIADRFLPDKAIELSRCFLIIWFDKLSDTSSIVLNIFISMIIIHKFHSH